MKKLLVIVPLALLLTVAGCGQTGQNNHAKASSNVSQTNKSTKASANRESNGVNGSKKSVSLSSSNQVGSKASDSSSSKNLPEQRYAKLKKAVFNQIASAKWPSSYAVAASQYLNIFATGDQSNYSIFFSPGSVALPFNDPTLQNINAELAIQKKTYPNASDAQAQVAVSQSTASLPKVALGDGIEATSQGAAGSTYLTWTEGRWIVTVKASAINGEDPLPLAKQVVAWFASHALPVPDQRGTVDLTVTNANVRQNQITWTVGNALYMISGLEPIKTIQEGTATR